jgi:hypothetical protein
MLTLAGFQDRLDRFVQSKKLNVPLEVSKFIEEQSKDYEVHTILLSEYENTFAKIFQDMSFDMITVHTVEDLMYEAVLRILIDKVEEVKSAEYYINWKADLFKFFVFNGKTND